MAQKHKRFLTVLIAAMVMVCLLTTTAFAADTPAPVFDETPVCYIHGDTNNDGTTSKDDALYILYSYLLGEEYPITHAASADLNGDSRVNTKDAIYMLYAALLEDEEHPLNGSVHEYYTPFWSWGYEEIPADPENPESAPQPVLKAILNIQCSCGEVIAQINGNITKASETAPTCLTSGSISYHAEAGYTYTVTVNGVESTVDVKYSTDAKDGYTQLGEAYIEELEPLGHAIGEPTCASNAVCANEGCDTDLTDDVVTPYSLPKLDTHSWNEGENTQEATCTQNSKVTYSCTVEGCGATKEIELEDKLAHDYRYVVDGDQKVEGTTCQYKKTYRCAICEDTVDGTGEGDTFYIHSFIPGDVISYATCQSKGSQRFVCKETGCDGSETREIAIAPNSHTWDNGTADAETGVTTYSCTVSGCDATKTTVSATNGATVSKDAIAANTELQLDNNATIMLDDATKEALPGDDVAVTITPATDAEKQELAGKMGDAMGQVGGTIYNFTMTSGNQQVSTFGDGKVTISLPYTLQDGDDVDAIDVWFIDDNGNLSVVKGQYANGFVTFTTTHFSYYTVTRLTPAQRCAVYGCVPTTYTHAATCTEDGYTVSICQRCGTVDESTRTTLTAPGHQYLEKADAAKAATCTEYGYSVEECSVCRHTVQKSAAPLGHSMVADTENSVAATCTAAGKNVTVCDRAGCSHSVIKDVAPLGHKWNEETAEVHYVSCTEAGYTEYTCDRCQKKLQADKQDPLGHAYVAEGWTWAKNYKSATLKIVCKNDHAHDQTVKAVIKTETSAASCTATGSATHTATVVFNGVTYTDSQTETLAKSAHTPEDSWSKNDHKHHRVCKDCEQTFDISDHAWGNCVVTTPASCVKAGVQQHICKVCNHSKDEAIPATGIHNLKNGVCTDCGFTENTCKHDKQYQVSVDTSVYGICEGMNLNHVFCDCGQVDYYTYYMDGCSWGAETVTSKQLPNGNVADIHSRSCSVCGLTEEYSDFNLLVDEENCTAQYSNYHKMSKGSTVIAEYYTVESSMPVVHPVNSTAVVEKLTDKGLCGDLVTTTCFCGKSHETYVDGCEWEYLNTDVPTLQCRKCGALAVERSSSTTQDTANSCIFYETQTYDVTLDGTAVTTYSTTSPYFEHNYALKDYTLNGSTCDEGMTLYHACADCGYDYYTFTTFHIQVNEKTTDLSAYGSCDTHYVESSCACGEASSDYFSGNRHNWTPSSADPSVLNCSTCGFTRTTTSTEGPKDANCVAPISATYTYSDGNGNSYSNTVEDSGYTEKHVYEPQYQLNGSSCTDGVTVSIVCQDCGKIDDSQTQTHNDHVPDSTKAYDLTQIGLCGGTIEVKTCVCGEVTGIMENGILCQWESLENSLTERCTVCGIHMTRDVTKLSTIDACHDRVLFSLIFHKADGTELLNISFTTISEEHRTIFAFTLKDEALGCDGGFDAISTCLDCGITSTYTDCYGHCVEPIAWDYRPNQLCGDLNLITFSCACGAQSHTQEEWEGGSCDFQHTAHKYKEDKATDGWSFSNIYTCSICGATKTDSEAYTPKNDGTCNIQVTQSLAYKTKSGKAAGSYTNEFVTEIHLNPDTSFTLLDETKGCDGGYTVASTCTKCGFVQTDPQTYYGCSTSYMLRSDVILEHDSICGDLRMEYNSCACGKEKGVNINSSCMWENHSWDDSMNCMVVTCSQCGLAEYNWDQSVKHVNSCTGTYTFGRKYILNGQELALNENYTTTHTVTHHSIIHSFVLNGTSCEEGYQVTPSCPDCGFVGSTWEELGHCIYTVSSHYLAEYGMCGGRIGKDQCACGQEGGIFLDWNACAMQWVDGTNGEEGYDYCAKCNTRMYSGRNGTVNNCIFTGDQTWRFVRDGVELLSFAAPVTEPSHEMRPTDIQLMNPDGTCEDGIYVTQKCLHCDHEESFETSGHWDQIHIELDLSGSGGCGGEIRVGGCACGKNAFFHRGQNCSMTRVHSTSTDANGILHNITTESCSTCGLEFVTDNYEGSDSASCKQIFYEDITITYQGQTYHRLNSWYQPNHDLEYISGSLVEGATSCEQGVNISWKCSKCGTTGTYDNYQAHALLKVDSIDLSDYGAICEKTALNHYKCVCGERESYDFAPEGKCDLDFQPTDHWINGVIEYAEQHTTEGWIITNSDAYLIRCAVNNDLTSGESQACPLTIRMSEYWLNEDCLAVEYQTWQLGYAEDADGNVTFATEFTVKTGESHAYHTYEWTEYGNITTNADGSYVNQHGNVCTACGSTDMNYVTHDANGLEIKHIWERLNKKDNGEIKSVIATSIYDLYYNNYAYESSTRWEYVGADDSTWWELYNYSNYDFSAQPCMRDEVYTSSNGGSDNRRNTACHFPCVTDYVQKAATCSQPGEKVHHHICPVCGYVETWEVTPIEPMHNWVQNSTTGIYTCSVCNLESNHGASGNIVMEDLSDTETDLYKIGYYVKENMNFYPAVSLITKNADGTDAEPVILSSDTYDFQFAYLTIPNDGICALTFSKTAVQSAAEAAMDAAGYTGSYSIRITFVPIDFADELDYSITFDSQTYAKEGA